MSVGGVVHPRSLHVAGQLRSHTGSADAAPAGAADPTTCGQQRSARLIYNGPALWGGFCDIIFCIIAALAKHLTNVI